MDRFVVRPSKRTFDEVVSEECQPQSAASELPCTLAYCPSISGIADLENDAIAVFDQFSRDRWYDLGDYLKNRQLLFGKRGGQDDTRRAHMDTIPLPLLQIYKIARGALVHLPDKAFQDLPEEPSGCAVNRYDVTANKRGSGLGPHRDKGGWRPIVVGVTLVEDRVMAFTDNYKERATRTYRLPTEKSSVYAFRDDMYTRWFHESLKKGASQRSTIYSITYRFLPDV